jgi:hypothetical protein
MIFILDLNDRFAGGSLLDVVGDILAFKDHDPQGGRRGSCLLSRAGVAL